MVRTLTSSRSQKGQRTVLLPGATAAEPWELWTTGKDAHCLQAGSRPDEIAAGRGATLALPVAEVTALPLWLQETDPKQFRGMIALQLEARGLHSSGREAIFDWAVVKQEESRSLVLAGVLANALPEEIETDSCPTFEISVRCFELPADSLVLWMEQDRLALAISRADRLAYFHALAEPVITTRVLQDLICIVAALRMQGVIGDLKQIMLWTELAPATISQLGGAFQVPVRSDERSVPVLPREGWSLTPARIGEVKRNRLARRWWARSLVLLVAFFVLVGVALGLRYFLLEREVAELGRWQTAHEEELDMVHHTQAAWRDLQPVIDTRSYPLEVLLHISESLPADQVHLTLFQAQGPHVLIKAEAKNLTFAFQFFDQLKKNKDLAGYTWEMAQPHSLANDITQLQIEGTYASGN